RLGVSRRRHRRAGRRHAVRRRHDAGGRLRRRLHLAGGRGAGEALGRAGDVRAGRLARAAGARAGRRAAEARLGGVPAVGARLGRRHPRDADRAGGLGAAGDLERGRPRRQRVGVRRGARDSAILPAASTRRRPSMARMTRREFLRASGTAAGALAIAGLPGCAMFRGETDSTSNRRVVVIGGGWGGATAAKYVRLADPTIEVVLLEPNRKFVSCPFSNLVLSGVRGIGSLTFGYGGLREYGV